MAKGFGGLPGNMQQLLKQAQKMQTDLKQAQDKAKEVQEEATSGGGMVKVVANGDNKIVSISIAKDVVDPNDIDMLQDMLLVAINDALSKANEKVQSQIQKITGSMNIPGF